MNLGTKNISHSHTLLSLAFAVLGACTGFSDRPQEAPDDRFERSAQRLEFNGGAEAGRFVGIGEDGLPLALSPDELRGVRSQATEEDAAERRADRASRGSPNQRGRTSTDYVYEQTDRLAPDVRVRVTAVLEEPPFDFSAFALARQAPDQAVEREQRAALIAQRAAQLAPSQDAFIAAAEALGARDPHRLILANAVGVNTTAGNVRALAALPGVVRLAPSTARLKPLLSWYGYNGVQTRTYLKIDSLIAPGFDGNAYGHVNGGPMRLALLDVDDDWQSSHLYNCPSETHPGWLDWGGGPTRLVRQMNCIDHYIFGIQCTPFQCEGDSQMHAYTVATVMAGDLQDGQDDQDFFGCGVACGSWTSPEADLYFYRIESGADPLEILGNGELVAEAIQQAIWDGVDVAVMPWGVPTNLFSNECDLMEFDLAGINILLRNALDAGTIPVAAAGNIYDPNGGCTVDWPAVRPETLTLGAARTWCESADGEPPCEPPVYTATTISQTSPRGGADIIVDGWRFDNEVSLVDLATMDSTQDTYWGLWGYQFTAVSQAMGTSIAAGVTGGALADLRHMYGWYGWNLSPREMIGDMLLMGDGWDADTGQKRTWGANNRSGFGRMKMHYPSNNVLVQPWGWHGNYAALSDGEVLCMPVGDPGPESPLVTQLTAVMTWYEQTYDNAGDIVLSVRHQCPPCLGLGSIIRSDASYDTRKRVRLSQAEISNRCLEVRATAYHVPLGQTRMAYVSFMYHSGNPNDF